MKKTLLGVVALIFVMSVFTACGGGSSEAKADKNADRVLTWVYQEAPDSLNYLTDSKNSSFRHIKNFIGGLYANDQYGNYVPELAESYEVSEGGTVYTFHIRKGMKWYTTTGEEYADVVAQDWVDAMKYAVEKKSPILWIVNGVIKNLVEYEQGKVDWDAVGVKAIDDYTLQYTTERPCPYFISMTTYAILYPANGEFLKSKGDDFGVVSPENILYCGAFILSEMTSKSKISYVKNENYWDKDNVHLSEVNFLYDDFKDPKSLINGFEAGTYNVAFLRSDWEDFDKYVEKYKDNAYYAMPNPNTYGFSLNFNRRATKYTNKDAEGLKNTHDALMNANFRKAVRAAFGRLDYMRQTMPEQVAKSTMHNTWTYVDLVSNSKGENYGSMINRKFNEINDREVDLSDGVNSHESKEFALEYLEKAKAEGVKLPVTLDLLAIDTETRLKQLKSLEHSIETNTDGQILIDLHVMPYDDVATICFRTNDPAQKDYDLNYFIGWVPDFADPKNYLDIYNPVNGDFIRNLGLSPLGEDPENDKIIEELELMKYNELLKAADAEYEDLDKRYELYAEAEAYLLKNCIVLPQWMVTRSLKVSKFVPFSGAYGLASESIWKYIQIQDDIVTLEQYNKAKAEWDAKRANK